MYPRASVDCICRPSLKVLKDFTTWSREIFETSHAQPTWDRQIGYMYQSYGYKEEAMRAFKLAEKSLPDNIWLLYKMAAIYRQSIRRDLTLRYAGKLGSHHKSLKISVEQFVRSYRNQFLQLETQNLIRMGRWDLAADLSKRLFSVILMMTFYKSQRSMKCQIPKSCQGSSNAGAKLADIRKSSILFYYSREKLMLSVN